MIVERDVLHRLEALGLRWYVTGSWSLGVYAEPRMTRDIDIVIDLARAGYETKIRPAFEADFLVNDPIDLGRSWLGVLIHMREIVRVDVILGRADAGRAPPWIDADRWSTRISGRCGRSVRRTSCWRNWSGPRGLQSSSSAMSGP